MKNKIKTAITTAAVVIMTGSFAMAEALATNAQADFPYFLLGCLFIGGMTIISLKNKFEKLYTHEAIGVFALYTLLISLFTNPVIDAIKTLVS